METKQLDYVKVRYLSPTDNCGRRFRYIYHDKNKVKEKRYELDRFEQILNDIVNIFGVEPTGEYIDLDDKTDLFIIKEEQ
jgi:hypothetical protein